MAKGKFRDLTGESFGRLIVVNREPNVKGRITYLCECSCGNKTTVLGGSLRSGGTKSCGCLHLESISKDLTDKVIGNWRVSKVSSKRAANGYRYWKCECTLCGKALEVSAESLLNGKSFSCRTCSAKNRAQQFCLRGHDTHVWGRSSSYACRACLKDKHLRVNYGISLIEFLKLLEAQDHKCSICGKDLGDYTPQSPGFGNGSRIEVDHDHKIKNKRLAVRGLLCGGRWAGCNRRIGRLDKIDWLKQVVQYLEEVPAQKLLRAMIKI